MGERPAAISRRTERLGESLVFQSLLVFALFVWLRPLAHLAARLDFSAYFEPVLVTQALGRF